MKKNLNKIFLFLILLSMVVGCFRDYAVVTGRVIDADGYPLEGATVQAATLDEVYSTTTTNDQGEYSIEVPTGAESIRAIYGKSKRTSITGPLSTSSDRLSCSNDIRIEDLQLNVTYYLTITGIFPSNGGTITFDPPGGGYLVGEDVTLTATPNSGFAFDYWASLLIGLMNPTEVYLNPITITVTESSHVQAFFVWDSTGTPPPTPSETYPPFEFEVSTQGWVARLGFIGCERTTEEAKNGLGSLKIYCDLDGADIDKQGGETRVILDSNIDLTGKTLSCYVYCPSGIIGSGGNKLILYAKDEYLNWGQIPEVEITTGDNWYLISGTITGELGYDITKIHEIGLLIEMSGTNTYSGPVYLDTVNWE